LTRGTVTPHYWIVNTKVTTGTARDMSKEIRKTISLPLETWRAIDYYRFKNGLPSAAEALRKILGKLVKP
jgi:hypothetical protein